MGWRSIQTPRSPALASLDDDPALHRDRANALRRACRAQGDELQARRWSITNAVTLRRPP